MQLASQNVLRPSPLDGMSQPFPNPEPAFGKAYGFLLWGAILCLLARALQHFKWDPPFRALLWSQARMEGIVTGWLGLDWNTYATSQPVEHAIDAIALGFGIIYSAAALSLMFFRRHPAAFILPVSLAGAGLLLLAYLQFLDANSRVGEFLEQTSQFGSILLLILVTCHIPSTGVLLAAKVCAACTFWGHGLYATGFYEIPAFWIYMVMKILPLSEAGAFDFLKVIGIIDVVLCVGIFIPRWNRYFLMYACFWGCVTALARIPGVYTYLDSWGSALRAAFEFAVRTPNWAVPLFILISNPKPAPQ